MWKKCSDHEDRRYLKCVGIVYLRHKRVVCAHSEACGGEMVDACCQCSSCRKIHGAEYFAGDEWKKMSNMVHARAHFGLQPMCEKLVAFGGVDGWDGALCNDDEANLDLLSSVEVVSSVESQWARHTWSDMPEAKAYFASISVTDLECT